ncbi:hypothetical protein [Streptomyces sp. NPDC026673]|uniref:hypothetical protein n=1 Tax=Streptomyces sp. NPDC026673 TaxID=3155724 RepID=UPI0033E69014
MAERLRNSAWRYVAGIVPVEDLPMLAAHALVDGDDSPALRELAGLSRRDDADVIRELYRRALSELGIPVPDEETAGRRVLLDRARALVQGESTPVEVACGLYAVAAATPEETHFLDTAAVYSEWLDPAQQPGWERDLRAAALAVLEAHRPADGTIGP